MVIIMERKTKLAIFGTSAVIILIFIVTGVMIVKKLTPSKEIMPITEYYSMEDSEVMILLQDEIYANKGMLIDGVVYIDYDIVVSDFNHRFYWDKNENILTYTTPEEILQAEVGIQGYSVMKSMIATDVDSDYSVVEVFADQVYIALDFVQQYSDMTYEFYENPNRIVVNYRYGDYLYSDVSKATQLRTGADIKSPILMQLATGTTLLYVDKEEAPVNGFVKVMTEDGIIGYVKEKHVSKSYYETLTSVYQEPVYTAQTRSGKINLVFHQVFNEEAAGKLDNLIKATKEVTVVSPTFFSVSDESGEISSLATTKYVEVAKGLGLEVWALVDDFDTEISMLELLSHTSSRENLSNALVEAAIEYKLNGINIDFEKISVDAGEHYIQFLRELSVKCRNNGIVLSVDSYVPTAYTEQYDREEQGKIVDYVVVMAYDEFYAGSEVAGPVASLTFVSDAVNNILELVPKEKTIIAIPFYTRLWKETAEGEVSSESLSMTPAAGVITDNGLEAVWDDAAGCYYVEYKKDGATYRMWQEEDKSIEEKMKLIYEADVAGVAAWKLGLEKESIWNVIVRYLH
ncbi:MAG: glycosyl hydrolase family 18 protein [Mobilitalea sp.]